MAGLALLLAGLAGCSGRKADPEAGVLESARRAYLDGRYLTAEDGYQFYLQAYPRGAQRLEAWQRLADISQDGRESVSEAASLLEAALLEFAADPKAAVELLSRAADLRLRLRHYDKAAVHVEALLALPGLQPARRVEASLQLGRLRVLVKDEDGALAVYAACRAAALPDSARCALSQGELLLRRDRVGEAESILQAVYTGAGNDPALRAQAGFDLGQLLEARNDKAGAKTLYAAVRDMHPNPLAVQKRLEALSGGRGEGR